MFFSIFAVYFAFCIHSFVLHDANIDIISINAIEYLFNIRFITLFNFMGLKERLLEFIEYRALDKALFERTAGLSNGFVDKSGENTRKSSLDKISTTFPDLNIAWLRTGEGNMLNEGFYHAPESDPADSGSETCEAYEVPLLPVSAIGGTLDGFYVQVKDSDYETMISPIKGVDFAITVSGDSMAPEYPSGAKILIKKINEKVFIDWGRTYVLDTVNGVVIKNIYPSREPQRITCRSINREFPDFEIDMNEDIIFGVYRVLLCLALK